jgi:hypothetical protein
MSKLTKALTAAAGNAGAGALYVEDVFSTYLYEGTGSNIAINNGIDLTGEGGLVIYRRRDGAENWSFQDTERGVNSVIYSDSINAATNPGSYGLASFNSDGFTTELNTSGGDYASWTFRKAEKFFDVVTWTGNSTARTISHNLGVTPGCIIVKAYSGGVSASQNWPVWHSSLANTETLFLNLSDAKNNVSAGYWNSTSPTSTEFSLGVANAVNGTGMTYVAYLFASDAGGFGDDGSESIIKCGSYTGTGSVPGNFINLGFEPQWVMVKSADQARPWVMVDNMRGMPVDGTGPRLLANDSAGEVTSASFLAPRPTGFEITNQNTYVNTSGENYTYIAIRRGPMKTPESGTEVFNVEIGNAGGSSTVPEFSAPFASDLFYMQNRNGGGSNYNGSRLAGNSYLLLETTSSEASGLLRWDAMNGMYFFSTNDYIGYMFKRATGFMDVVTYIGTGVVRTVNHNLGVAPEFIICKSRDQVNDGVVYSAAIGDTKKCRLFSTNGTIAAENRDAGDGTNYGFTLSLSTDSTIRSGIGFETNRSGYNFVAYLFATLAGVSKVGSYTGTAADLNVDCGFSAGARFVMIKRTDSSGDWYVWDSARGIVAGNDPYLLLNSTAAQVTSTDYIDPLSSGFTVTSSAPDALNASGGTYTFLAIA